MWPLVTSAQMRALDAHTIERLGVPGAVLMENAGRGVVAVLVQLQARGQIDLQAARLIVVAGPGNNGGDGFVIARHLHMQGLAVQLLLCAERERVRGDALTHLLAAQACGVPTVDCGDIDGVGRVAAVLSDLQPRDVIVDALLGTGVSRPVAGALADVVAAVNRSAARRLAVDLPSGMDADRGLPSGSASGAEGGAAAVVSADWTVTFALPKLGLCGAPGFVYAGEIFVVDIAIPPALHAQHGVRARLLDGHCVQSRGRPPSPLGHKGSHGHLLIIAGSRGKSGAALLCTRAALRTGVGLCTLAAPAAAVDAGLGTAVLEAMSLPYDLPDAMSDASPADPALLGHTWLHAAQGKQALAVGPGLPVHPSVARALRTLLTTSELPALPIVLDADALNQLVGHDEVLQTAAQRGHALVLTPHPGEAARLLRSRVADIQADRVAAAQELCRRTGAVILLKGARTVICAPPNLVIGDVPPLSICPSGNDGMGTGGMGDVLTGILGALLTAGWPAYDAACAAAYLHGRAADRLRQDRAPGALLLASDVIDALDATRRQLVLDSALGLSTQSALWPVRPLLDLGRTA